MTTVRPIAGPRITRRHTLATGLLFGTGYPARMLAQASPVATPGQSTPDRARLLVDATWLASHRSDTSVVLVGLMAPKVFAQGHIPGSATIDWPALEVTDTSDASISAWRDTAEGIIANLGITRDHTVIVYDEGTLFAARLWWVLQYLGHPDVRILDGGLPAWQQARYEVETGAGNPPPSALEPYRGTPRPEVLAQIDEVRAGVGDSDVIFVDARAGNEYVAGHIPGAVNINYPDNAESAPPRFWKSADDLRAMYAAAGVYPARMVIPYCSTGVRSAVTFFSLRLCGYERVALYTGSWAEWGSRSDTPATTGDQP